MEVNEYFNDLMNDLDHSTVIGNYKAQTFLEKVVPIMEEQGSFLDLNAYYVDKGRYGRLDGVGFNGEGENSNELILLVNNFDHSDSLNTLTNTKIDQLKNAALRFYKNALKLDFLSSLEESSDEYAAGKEIYHAREQITKVKIIILTNNILSNRVSDLRESNEDIEIPIIIDIWDINRIFQLESSKSASEAIEIDLLECSQGIPALLATQTEDLTSYLCVADGQLIADLYDKYGGRLLEANVRSFLQFRGKINSGIRKTINKQPQLFFSYNNGITATANEIKIDEHSNKITFIKNFQIVNGGQTTASLLMTSKKDKADLSKIKLQLKLNVTNPEKADELISNISRFANSQNAIKDSDFFTNHPFHRRFEEFSRRIWAPKSIDYLKQTHWYYERARGSYLNDQAKLSKSESDKFKSENPKQQLITKSDLAKIHLIFNGKPHDSVKGAEIAFREFAKIIGDIWDKDSDLINENFYESTIAKLIIWQACKKIVYDNDNFVGNTKATITAYTLHVIIKMISSFGSDFDYRRIWQAQTVNQFFYDQFQQTSEKVNEYLIALSNKHEKAILSYAKSKACLDEFNEKTHEGYFKLDIMFRGQLVSKDKVMADSTLASNTQNIDNIVRNLNELCNVPLFNWQTLIQHVKDNRMLAVNDMEILTLIPNVMSGIKRTTPSDKQLKKINDILNKLESEGVYLDKIIK